LKNIKDNEYGFPLTVDIVISTPPNNFI